MLLLLPPSHYLLIGRAGKYCCFRGFTNCHFTGLHFVCPSPLNVSSFRFVLRYWCQTCHICKVKRYTEEPASWGCYARSRNTWPHRPRLYDDKDVSANNIARCVNGMAQSQIYCVLKAENVQMGPEYVRSSSLIPVSVVLSVNEVSQICSRSRNAKSLVYRKCAKGRRNRAGESRPKNVQNILGYRNMRRHPKMEKGNVWNVINSSRRMTVQIVRSSADWRRRVGKFVSWLSTCRAVIAAKDI